mgnify:CR=1 FL=1
MKALRFNGVITSISSKKDRSLGLRIETPELSPQERSEFMENQGINLDIFLKPLDETPEEVIEIDKDLERKSQSQRIRATLYVLWEQEGKPGDFATYYREKTEKYLNYLKEKIES